MTYTPPAKFVAGKIVGNAAEPLADPTMPESETPEVDPDIEKLMNLAHELWDDGMEDSNKIITECCERIQRRLSLAQTEIKGHMRVGEELRADHLAAVIHSKRCEERADQAQSRIAELEKDAVRYRWLSTELGRGDVPRSYMPHWMDKIASPSQLDEYIDASLKDRA